MKKITGYLAMISVLLVSLILASYAPATRAESPATFADLVITDGAIYTFDAARVVAEAVAIKDRKISFVGSDDQAKKWIGPDTRVIKLDGKAVLPGLHDCHVHLVDGGVNLNECNLNEVKSVEKVLSIVESYARSHPDKKWITGAGWSLALFENGCPTKELLDKIVPDRPVCLASQDYHSAWVNTKALELAGITSETENPRGGIIEKTDGQPNGTLRESAIDLVSRLAPKSTLEEHLKGLRRAQKLANQLGITSIQDALVNNMIFDAYNTLSENGELTVKVAGAIRIDPDEDDKKQVRAIEELRKKIKGDRFRITSAKLFMDGVIEAKTAALIDSYNDEKKSNGLVLFEADRLKKLVSLLESKNIQVHVHAIGDKAVKETLDAFENCDHPERTSKLRNHIAHLELVDAKDRARFQKLNVGATIQALWAHRDDYVSKLTEPVLGGERSKGIYPIRGLFDANARLVGGSDWPVSSLNPFHAMEVAVRRCPPGGKDSSVWLPQERVPLRVMLEAYTINGAYTNHQDERTGSIEPGKAADLIVLDKDPFGVPAHKIHDLKVLLTLLDGKEVYREEGFLEKESLK